MARMEDILQAILVHIWLFAYWISPSLLRIAVIVPTVPAWRV
jgi:hypothetical protein